MVPIGLIPSKENAPDHNMRAVQCDCIACGMGQVWMVSRSRAFLLRCWFCNSKIREPEEP